MQTKVTVTTKYYTCINILIEASEAVVLDRRTCRIFDFKSQMKLKILT